MKKTIASVAIAIVSVLHVQAQKELDELTYDNSQDISFFSNIDNNTDVRKYITANGNNVSIGDTLILGIPTSQESNTKTIGAAYGDKLVGGVADSRSTTKKTYEFIKMGRPAGFGSVMTAMNGDAEVMADISLKNTTVVVNEIKAYHRGSKKKPLYIVMVLGEINGRAFGINKYLSVMDSELAIESGEIMLKNRKMTRDEAIAKLKEAKELVEIEMMSKDEFEQLKQELAPFIR